MCSLLSTLEYPNETSLNLELFPQIVHTMPACLFWYANHHHHLRPSLFLPVFVTTTPLLYVLLQRVWCGACAIAFFVPFWFTSPIFCFSLSLTLDLHCWFPVFAYRDLQIWLHILFTCSTDTKMMPPTGASIRPPLVPLLVLWFSFQCVTAACSSCSLSCVVFGSLFLAAFNFLNVCAKNT